MELDLSRCDPGVRRHIGKVKLASREIAEILAQGDWSSETKSVLSILRGGHGGTGDIRDERAHKILVLIDEIRKSEEAIVGRLDLD